jgi:hypothetical protein
MLSCTRIISIDSENHATIAICFITAGYGVLGLGGCPVSDNMSSMGQLRDSG